MRREIFSAAMPIYKAIFLFIFGCSVPNIILFTIYGIRNTPEIKTFQIYTSILLMVAVIFFSALFVRLALGWKRVAIDNEGLIITEANFFVRKTSTLVPFEKIKAARQNFILRGNPGTVFVEFTEPAFFGNKISFVPAYRPLTFFEHPIVEEINRLANQKKGFKS